MWLREQAERLGLLQVWVKESTDELHNISVQGPTSRDLLTPLIWTPPTQTPFAELKWFRFAIARLGGPQGFPLIASRTGYSGELGYELFCHPNDAPALWDAVVEAGEPHGLMPLGLDALDMLRIEAGLDLRRARSSTIRSILSKRASGSPSPPTRRTSSSARRRSPNGARIRSASSSGSSWRGTSPLRTAIASTSVVPRSA